MPAFSKRILIVGAHNYKEVDDLSTIDSAPDVNGNPGRYFTTPQQGLDPVRNFFGGWYTSRRQAGLFGGETQTLLPASQVSALAGPSDPRSNTFRNTQADGGLKIEITNLRWVDDTTSAETLRVSLSDQAINILNNSPAPAQGSTYMLFPFLDMLYFSGIPAMVARADQNYFDHIFTADLAYHKEELKQAAGGMSAYYYDIVPEYSFLIEEYETVTLRDNLSDNILPNIYAFLSEQNSEFRDPPSGPMQNAVGGSFFHQLITLNSLIYGVSVDIISDKGEKIGERDEGQYFKKYAATWTTAGEPAMVQELAARYSKTLIPNDSFDLMEEAYSKRNLFPMYNTIEFNTSTNTELVDIFAELKVNDLIVQEYMRGAGFNTELSAVGTQESMLISGSVLASNQVNLYPLAYKGFDINTFKETYFNEIQPFSGVVFGPGGNEAIDDMVENPLSRNIMAAISKSKIKEIYKKYARTYVDILKGRPAHTEVLAYKINKTNRTTGVTTDIIISNSNKLELVQYIDTQVKYNTAYEYNIKQIVAVFGSKVGFHVTNDTEGLNQVVQIPETVRYAGDPEALLEGNSAWRRGYVEISHLNDAREWSFVNYYSAFTEVRISPSIRLYEIPYAFTRDVRIIDDPPCPPEIVFIPYKGVDNKILINVNNAFGEYIQEPVIINPGDAATFATIEANQPRIPPGKVRFAGDDRAERFELYRLAQHPTSYESFKNAQLATLQTAFNGQRGDCSAFKDIILPNTKYYYMARTIDYHGNLSNPTPVFRVELVSNDGIIYPVIHTVEFKTEIYPKKTSRTMRRYLQISPAYLQQVISPDQYEVFRTSDEQAHAYGGAGMWTRAETIELNKIKFGLSEVSSWGKSFKIRLTSTDTGRKIDINTTLRVLFDDD